MERRRFTREFKRNHPAEARMAKALARIVVGRNL